MQHRSGAANFPHRHANSKGTLHHLSFSQFCPTFPQTSQLISSSSFTHLSLSHSPPKPPVSTEFQGIPLQSSEAALQHVRVCVWCDRDVRAWTVHTQANRAKKNFSVMPYVLQQYSDLFKRLFSPESAVLLPQIRLHYLCTCFLCKCGSRPAF